uniref:Uncharacterized protein n=1 Tax=uncultured marine virus TaxID=186617 RepID=A0A0F7LAW4_9VIRU|nr:hypothetical protein [uncultured marine virus]
MIYILDASAKKLFPTKVSLFKGSNFFLIRPVFLLRELILPATMSIEAHG